MNLKKTTFTIAGLNRYGVIVYPPGSVEGFQERDIPTSWPCLARR